MNVVGDLKKTDTLSQIGIIADSTFKAGEWEFQQDIAIGRTKDDKLITACIKTDREGKLLYFNIIETKLKGKTSGKRGMKNVKRR